MAEKFEDRQIEIRLQIVPYIADAPAQTKISAMRTQPVKARGALNLTLAQTRTEVVNRKVVNRKVVNRKSA